MKRLFAMLIITLLVTLSYGAVVYTTVNTNFVKAVDSDKITNATAVNGYATNKDAIASTAFDGNKLSGRLFTVMAAITDTIDGTSVAHLTPIIQASSDGTTWGDVATLEDYSSSAVTIGTTWLIIVNLEKIYSPYIRVVYVYHTSLHATLSDATNIGGVRTTMTVYTK